MEFFLLLLGAVVGVPALTIIGLLVRTHRLRADVDDLKRRLRQLELAAMAPLAVAREADASAPRAEHAPAAPIEPEPPPPVVETPVMRPEAVPPPLAASEPLVPPPLVPPPPIPPLAAAPAEEPESLESRIGGRWLLNIGIAAIVIGVAYLEKLAIDNHWIGETARVIQGGLIGAVLIYAGARFVRRGDSFYGQMLAGGGVAILYVSTYAAFNYYHLIERPTAFALMIGVTALGAFLADRYASQGLAVLAVGGGFVTPFLLPGTTDAQIALFTYVAIMIGGTVYLAARRDWPLLHVVSYVFTLITVAGWADRFYAPEKYLRTEIYLTIYGAMFAAIARSCRQLDSPFSAFASWFLWTAPIAYYAASLLVLAGHPLPLLVWLMGVALVGGVLSVTAGSRWGLAVWLAAAVPLLAWTLPPTGLRWLPQGLLAVASLYAIGLGAQLRTAGEKQPLGVADVAWLHLSALLMFAGAYFLLEPGHLAAAAPVGALFALWNAVLAAVFWTRDRDRAVHFAALAFTLSAIAIALQFDGPSVTVGWAAEAAAIVALGFVERRPWLRTGGALLFMVALARTLDLLVSPPPASYVVLLNPRAACALLVFGLCYFIAWLHRRDPDGTTRPIAIGVPLIAAQIVSLVLLTTEIHRYFAVRQAAFTGELMVSVTWAVYATALIVIGLQRRYALVRYFAIVLFGITISKVFFSDLAELERIYRVVSVIGLGITLLVTSYLYQRTRGSSALRND